MSVGLREPVHSVTIGAPIARAAATTLAKRGRKARRTVASGWAML